MLTSNFQRAFGSAMTSPRRDLSEYDCGKGICRQKKEKSTCAIAFRNRQTRQTPRNRASFWRRAHCLELQLESSAPVTGQWPPPMRPCVFTVFAPKRSQSSESALDSAALELALLTRRRGLTMLELTHERLHYSQARADNINIPHNITKDLPQNKPTSSWDENTSGG